MKILYLSERDPRDTHFGGAQRTHFIWEALQQIGDVYCIYFSFYDTDKQVAPNIWQLRKWYELDCLRNFGYRICRKILKNMEILPLWPVAPRTMYPLSHYFPDVKFDLVVCRYCFDVGEMHFWNFPKVFVDFDDHPLEMFDTLKSKSLPRWKRLISRFIIKKQVDFLAKRISGGWISNPEQVNSIKTSIPIVPLRNIAMMPSKDYCTHYIRKPFLVTIGAMGYSPNYEGVDIFLRDIWPHVHSRFPQIEFYIIGKGTPKKLSTEWDKIEGVKQLGFVDNLEKVYQECLASVVPVYSGGGTCIKTLESLAFSRVCISSTFGARGLHEYSSLHDIGLYIYCNVDDFIYILSEKILDEQKRCLSEARANQYILENHTKAKFVSTIITTLMK